MEGRLSSMYAQQREDKWRIPDERDGLIMATHASNAVNKWLKGRNDGLTAHCLRHTMRDRLRPLRHLWT